MAKSDNVDKIGETSSGKPVMNGFDHEAHKDFTSHDHVDAALRHASAAIKVKANKEYDSVKGPDREKFLNDKEEHHLKQMELHLKAGKAKRLKKSDEEILDLIQERLDLFKSKDEKPIDKTRSGKPVYRDVNHPAHDNFTSEDHLDAWKIKSPGRSSGVNHENQHRHKVLSESEVIGTTESGKSVYDLHDHPAHKGFTERDHMNASNIHGRSAYEAKKNAIAHDVGSHEWESHIADAKHHQKQRDGHADRVLSEY